MKSRKVPQEWRYTSSWKLICGPIKEKMSSNILSWEQKKKKKKKKKKFARETH